jgi:riboflavin synthase
MFTGIVERRATTIEVRTTTGGKRLAFEVECGGGLGPWAEAEPGESIAVSGVCLTVVEAAGTRLAFEAVPETLGRTRLGRLSAGDPANVERSLRVGDRFGGHYVTGHVDGVGTVRETSRQGDQVLFRIGAAPSLLAEVIVKGSVAVDGVSLTVVEVSRAAGWFSFAAIPHTLAVTTLGGMRAGDAVNLETDAFGKWVLHGLRELERG